MMESPEEDVVVDAPVVDAAPEVEESEEVVDAAPEVGNDSPQVGEKRSREEEPESKENGEEEENAKKKSKQQNSVRESLCGKCNKRFPDEGFTKSQLQKKVAKRKCKICQGTPSVSEKAIIRVVPKKKTAPKIGLGYGMAPVGFGDMPDFMPGGGPPMPGPMGWHPRMVGGIGPGPWLGRRGPPRGPPPEAVLGDWGPPDKGSNSKKEDMPAWMKEAIKHGWVPEKNGPPGSNGGPPPPGMGRGRGRGRGEGPPPPGPCGPWGPRGPPPPWTRPGWNGPPWRQPPWRKHPSWDQPQPWRRNAWGGGPGWNGPGHSMFGADHYQDDASRKQEWRRRKMESLNALKQASAHRPQPTKRPQQSRPVPPAQNKENRTFPNPRTNNTTTNTTPQAAAVDSTPQIHPSRTLRAGTSVAAAAKKKKKGTLNGEPRRPTCGGCGQRKLESEFTKSQLRQKVAKRKCRVCQAQAAGEANNQLPFFS